MADKSKMDLCAEAFESWITAGSIAGSVNVVEMYLEKAVAELAKAIKKSESDGDYAVPMESLALALEQVKTAAAESNAKCRDINEARLEEYRAVCV